MSDSSFILQPSSFQPDARPQIAWQVESFLTYLHLNGVAVSSAERLIEIKSLQEIVRLFDPVAGRFGYLPDERHYPDVYFVDTLCRYSGMTIVEGQRLKVAQYGYLYLAREPSKRLIMLVSGFVNDYPWFVLFPRGHLAERITESKAGVLDFILRQEAEKEIGIERFAEDLADYLEITIETEAQPYPKLMFEWIVRHIVINPLARLSVFELLDEKAQSVRDIRLARGLLLTNGGRELLTLREVKYR